MTGSTGSTSRRSLASDRRRSSRSTSGSHNSRSAPPGRNSPLSSDAVRDEPVERVVDDARRGRPQRRAGSAARNGPCVRAHRASRPSSAPTTGAEERLRHTRRRRHADAVAVARDVLHRDPALLAADPRPDRASRRGELGQVERRLDRARRRSAPRPRPSTGRPAGAGGRGPGRRSSRWRSSTSAWRLSSRSASASGSSSSRSSSWPSSSRSRSRSSVSACARRSASGASPSYM